MAPKRRRRGLLALASGDQERRSEPRPSVGARRTAHGHGGRLEIPAGKRRKPSGDVLCARCGASSADRPWHMVQSKGEDVPSTACRRCYDIFHRAWADDFEWPELCGKLKEDREMAKAFDASVGIGGGALKPFPEQGVVASAAVGYRLVRNLAFVHVADWERVFGVPLSASAANVRLDRMPDENGVMQKGILIRHPLKPWTDVQVYHDVNCRQDTHHLATAASLRPDQADGVHRRERRAFFGGLPPSMRHPEKAPTLEFLRKRFDAARRAAGCADEASSEGAGEAERSESDSDGAPSGDGSDRFDDGRDDGDELRSRAGDEVGSVGLPPQRSREQPGDDAFRGSCRDFGPERDSAGDAMLTSRGSSAMRRGPVHACEVEDRSSPAASSAAMCPPAPLARSRSSASLTKARTSDALSMASDRESASKPKSSGECMSRVVELESRLVLEDILDGVPMGDKLYAARRFKAKDQTAAMKLQRVVRKASCAEMLAAPRLDELAREKRVEMLVALGPTTKVSLNYSRKLLTLEVQEAHDDTALPSIVFPWALRGEGGGGHFNLVSPRLCQVACHASSKVEVCEKLIVEAIFVPRIMRQHSADAILSAVGALSDGLPADDELKSMPQEYAQLAEIVGAACAALRILVDANPTVVAESEGCIRLARDIVMGQNLRAPWPLIADALEESREWLLRKNEFRRCIMTDLTLGRDMQSSMAALRGNVTLDALVESAGKLRGWLSRCRRGGTAAFEDCFVGALDRFVEHLSASTTHDQRLSQARHLDALTSELAAVGFRDPPPLKARFVELRRRLRQITEESNRGLKEECFLHELSEFGANPGQKDIASLTDCVVGATGVKFSASEHVSCIRRALEVCVDSLADALQVVGATGILASADADAAGVLAKNAELATTIGHAIAEPSSDDTQTLNTLRFLQAVWSSIAASQSLSEAQTRVDADPEVAEELWSTLRACLQATVVGTSDLEPAGMKPWGEMQAAFKAKLDERRSTLAAFSERMVTEARLGLEQAIERLEKISGGKVGGGSWRAGCDGADWPALLAAAQATLFDRSQKGIARQLASGRSDVQDSAARLRMVCKTFDMEASCTDVHEKARATVRLASITIVEARVVQMLKDSKMTLAIKRSKLQEEIDNMIDMSLTGDDLHPTVFAKTMEVLRT